MPADTRTYLDEVTLQSFMKTQTTAIDVLSATETQKTAQLQGNMQRVPVTQRGISGHAPSLIALTRHDRDMLEIPPGPSLYAP
ncbi:hypothetical protein RB195_022251 [Necator americanus]|uniref:Jun-like transcription factor domain-containing protein n=1 Tax=Necator americanus TaxID=51031 RepID=A0ABR1EET4_NECAM